jgi:hypothetical protein
MDNGVDVSVRPKHEEDVQDDAHASDEHHKNDDIQQEDPICTSTRKYGMEISSVWMFVKSTLVLSIESWHTCSLVVGVLFNGFLRMFHSLAWQQYLCDKEEMFLL